MVGKLKPGDDARRVEEVGNPVEPGDDARCVAAG